MRNVWFTADLHLDHRNIIRYCKRPFDNIQQMNKILVDNWNNRVKKDDLVYFLGDFCFGDARSWFPYLNGEIMLIKGNHDKSNLKFFNKVYRSYSMKIGDFNCVLNHRPIYPNDYPDPFNDHDKSINPDGYDFVICGHVHEKWKVVGKSVNIGVDQWDFKPVLLEELIEFLNIKRG